MFRRRRRALSDAAGEYRAVMWLCAALAVIGYGYFGIRTYRELANSTSQPASPLPQVFGLSLGLAATVVAVFFGLRAYRRALDDQKLAADRSMIVLLAAQLGHQSDEALTAIAGRGGPAAEAARLILRGRRERAGRPGAP